MKAWADWSKDPAVCDVAAMNNFNDMLWAVTHHLLMDGDVFAMPIVDSGIAKIQLIEGDWITSPQAAFAATGSSTESRSTTSGSRSATGSVLQASRSMRRRAFAHRATASTNPKEAFDSDGNPRLPRSTEAEADLDAPWDAGLDSSCRTRWAG